MTVFVRYMCPSGIYYLFLRYNNNGEIAHERMYIGTVSNVRWFEKLRPLILDNSVVYSPNQYVTRF